MQSFIQYHATALKEIFLQQCALHGITVCQNEEKSYLLGYCVCMNV